MDIETQNIDMYYQDNRFNIKYIHFSTENECNNYISNNNIKPYSRCCSNKGYGYVVNCYPCDNIENDIKEDDTKDYIDKDIIKEDNTMIDYIDYIIEDDIIDDEYKKESKKICCICHEITFEKTICNHFLCNNCDTLWKKYKNTCPCCRKQI